MATFEVLAEESRRRILDLLAEGERPVGELVALLSLSQPAVSKHLKVLREAGLVESRTDAQRRIYRVNPEPLRAPDEVACPLSPPMGGPAQRAGAPLRNHGRQRRGAMDMSDAGTGSWSVNVPARP